MLFLSFDKENNSLNIKVLILTLPQNSGIHLHELQRWKGPCGSLSPAPGRETQWGIEPPTSGFTTRYLNHWTIQQFLVDICICVSWISHILSSKMTIAGDGERGKKPNSDKIIVSMRKETWFHRLFPWTSKYSKPSPADSFCFKERGKPFALEI